MNIGFDAKRLFNNTTGLGNYSRSLVLGLQQYYPEQRYHLFAPKASPRVYSEAFFDTARFTIHTAPPRSISALWRSKGVVRDLVRSKMDIYHGLSNELPIGLSRSGIKSIVTIHDLIFKAHPETYPLAERLVYDWKFKHACHQADYIVAISEYTKRDIVRYYGIDADKIGVIYQSCHPIFWEQAPCLDIDKIREKYQLPMHFFLSVGTIEKRKNLELIIEAYRLDLGKQLYPIVVVGKGGAYKQYCHDLIAQYKLDSRFVFLDCIEDIRELQTIYKAASAMVYPSRYEGFGVPIIEALFSKIPVVTTRNASLPEAAGPDSYYVPADEGAALMATLLEIMQADASVKVRVHTSYEYANRHFEAATLATRWMQLYERILSE